MAYLLDADVFIRAKNLHYDFKFCPAFWDWLITANRAGRVFSIERVKDELRAGEDELSQWAAQYGPEFFLPPEERALNAFSAVSAWALKQNYDDAAINTFLSGADYYLTGQALADGHTVVTHEARADTKRKIKIPNACGGLGVACISPFEMLRRERARFVLERVP